jgi:hypothetical protein
VPDIHGRRQLEFSRIGEGGVDMVMPKHKYGMEYGSEEDGFDEREGYVFQLLMIQHSKVEACKQLVDDTQFLEQPA